MKEFLPFRLDTVDQCLWRRSNTGDDERLLLTPKAFAVLRYLVEHAGRLVTQDELLDAVWPGVHVQPQAIKKVILDIRSTLGDRAKQPFFIETVHRRGYRFIAAVTEGGRPGPAVPVEPARLVGRERPSGELRDCLGKALRGERQVVFITGEPGIGKTALADEFQRQAAAEVPGLRIARGQCIEGYGGREAYYPMLEALGELCRGPGGDSVVQTLAAQAPTWLVQFPALVKREQRETLQREILGATRERMLREIGDVLETITEGAPLILVFEDLQWVDYSTVDLISALARRRSPAKLMLIATERPMDMVIPEHPLKAVKADLLQHQLSREIALEPLGEAEVAEYLAAESPVARVPEGLAKLVYHHSEGNPLFIVAALDHMTEQGLVSRERGAWKLLVPLDEVALGVPQKLRRMIDAQIDRLTSDEQRTLEVASVAGMSFSTEVCAAAGNLGPEAFEDLCQELSRRHQFVHSVGTQRFPDGIVCSRYKFVHALYREVLYRRQAPGRRANLHRRIAERLEALFSARLREVAAELAHHSEEGFDWARAVKCLQLQAETAGQRYAPREAVAILRHALELSSKLPEAERAASETAILETLATMYVVSFDMRAIETYETLAARAAHYGLIDVEVRALIDMVYPLSWSSSERCLEVVKRALRLSGSQKDPLMRARTRASCLVRRVWAGGWNAQDAEECQNALAEIRKSGDRLLVASHLIDCNFIEWSSSRYREAKESAVENLAILFEAQGENPYLSFAYWLSQFTLPWTLLFLGEWGEALAEIRAGISMAEKNGDHYRGQTLRLYQAWVHLNAMDFVGVVRICESVLPELGTPGRGPWRRFTLIFAGSAETALGNYGSAHKYLSTAADEMQRQTLIFDWYFRMMLRSAVTELWLAKGDLVRARGEAQGFLQVTLATAERTWQALAWEINARIAMEQRDFAHARDGIANALSTMEGFEVPLARWRVHAIAAEVYRAGEDVRAAEHHRELGRATILKLADSLAAEEPCRKTFLSAPSICRVLGNAETPNGVRPRPD
jgi:DNA-binding winged helix-turn-helix (wHTH) protein